MFTRECSLCGMELLDSEKGMFCDDCKRELDRFFADANYVSGRMIDDPDVSLTDFWYLLGKSLDTGCVVYEHNHLISVGSTLETHYRVMG